MPIKKWAVSKNAIDRNQFAKITKGCWADILSGWILRLSKNVSAEMLIVNYAFTSSVGTDKCSYICWVKLSPFLYNLSILEGVSLLPLWPGELLASSIVCSHCWSTPLPRMLVLLNPQTFKLLPSSSPPKLLPEPCICLNCHDTAWPSKVQAPLMRQGSAGFTKMQLCECRGEKAKGASD